MNGIPTNTETIDYKEFVKRMNQCFVYAWVRGGTYLYIGMTTIGMRRFVNHHVVIDGLVEETNTFQFWYCASEEHARRVETNLIHALEPLFNKVNNIQKKKRRPMGLTNAQKQDAIRHLQIPSRFNQPKSS